MGTVGCDTVYVVGVPNKQPNTPGGPWMFDLGVVTGQSACLSIPSSKVFRIIEEPSGHETRVVWTTADTLTLGLARRPWTRTDAVGVLAAPAMGWMALLPWRRTPREQGAAAGRVAGGRADGWQSFGRLSQRAWPRDGGWLSVG